MRHRSQNFVKKSEFVPKYFDFKLGAKMADTALLRLNLHDYLLFIVSLPEFNIRNQKLMLLHKFFKQKMRLL